MPPEAETQLIQLYRYLARTASSEIAARYTEAVVGHCESLTTFPYRGLLRNDVRPGLRITHSRRRTTIAFTVQGDRIEIVGVFHGGRNYETIVPRF